MKTSDAKEKKQLRELSDEELEQVNGGDLNARLARGCDLDTCPKLGKKTDLVTCKCI